MNSLTHARAMRLNPTEAERILWRCLRKRSLNGFRFSRQIRIGPLIADFVCREKKLIVRQSLEAEGYRVLRVGITVFSQNATAFCLRFMWRFTSESRTRVPTSVASRHLLPAKSSGLEGETQLPSTPFLQRGGGGGTRNDINLVNATPNLYIPAFPI